MTKAILSHSSRPASTTGGRFIIWARKNLFSSWSNSLLTIVCLWLIWELIPPLLNWAFLQANWVGSTRADCTKAGACWVFIHERFGQFMYGLYPHEQRWRINLALVIGLLSIAVMFWKSFLTVADTLRAGLLFIRLLFGCCCMAVFWGSSVLKPVSGAD